MICALKERETAMRRKPELKYSTYIEAERFLRDRYEEQCERDLNLRTWLSLPQYIKANIKAAMKIEQR
jgi:hypothetical protein